MDSAYCVVGAHSAFECPWIVPTVVSARLRR
jgi:uncharacterized Fe-S cluster protein YjdI